MTKQEVISSINKNYHPLPEACNEELLSCTEILKLDKKEILVKEGQYAPYNYYIAKGSIRAYYLKNGKDITDWFAFENELVCSIQSYFQGKPSVHYIEVVEPSIVIKITRENVDHLSDKYREFDRLTKFLMANTILTLQHRITTLLFETAQQKYDNLLAMRSDIELRVPLIHIASYLGITIETLSRIRNQKRRI